MWSKGHVTLRVEASYAKSSLVLIDFLQKKINVWFVKRTLETGVMWLYGWEYVANLRRLVNIVIAIVEI